MFVWATRTLWRLALRGAFFAALFVGVIAMQVAVVTALRAMSWAPGSALFLSGLVVLAVVLGAHFAFRWWAHRKAQSLEAERFRLGLPQGACCVVWRGGPGDAIPWNVEGQITAYYPAVAQALKVEGCAVVEFEVGHDGRAKNLHCVDVWPSLIFYEAAAAALSRAQFTPNAPGGPRFGPSYRVPFVFRIRGASQSRDQGARAKAGSRSRSEGRRS